jgi:protein TonB
VSEAHNALSEGKVDEAERLIQIAAEAGVDEEDLDDLVRKAREQRIAARGAAMTRLSQLFNERLSQGKLLEPENDGAKHYLAQMIATDAEHPSTLSAKDSLEKAIANAESEAAAARAAAAATAKGPELVAPTSLKKIRHVDPRYPQAARSRELAGWVDLELTVETDGSVGAVSVVGSEPAEVFDQAAIDAQGLRRR